MCVHIYIYICILRWYLVVVERLVDDAGDGLSFVRDTDQYSHVVQEPWRYHEFRQVG